MKDLPKLCGLDSKGRVKEWSVYVDGDTVYVEHGLKDGKKQIKTTVCKPKNVGKSNETTPEQQAQLEAQSKWNKQKDKNYHEDLDNAKPLENPMLAQDYRKQGHRMGFPCIAQPKLDGVRCLIKRDGDRLVFKSRGNKEYPIIEDIARQLFPVFRYWPNLMLDGELYIHGKPLEDIVSAVKKHNDDTKDVVFVMFDSYSPDEPDMPVEQRLQGLKKLSMSVILPLNPEEGTSRVYLVDDHLVRSEDEMVDLHNTFVERGFEGIMLRQIDSPYKLNTRSADLQKYKCFEEGEFEILDVGVDKLNHAVFVVAVGDEIVCEVKMRGSDEYRKHLWETAEDHIGKWITVRYQAKTKYGSLQFPVGVRFRDVDKNGVVLE